VHVFREQESGVTSRFRNKPDSVRYLANSFEYDPEKMSQLPFRSKLGLWVIFITTNLFNWSRWFSQIIQKANAKKLLDFDFASVSCIHSMFQHMHYNYTHNTLRTRQQVYNLYKQIFCMSQHYYKPCVTTGQVYTFWMTCFNITKCLKCSCKLSRWYAIRSAKKLIFYLVKTAISLHGYIGNGCASKFMNLTVFLFFIC